MESSNKHYGILKFTKDGSTLRDYYINKPNTPSFDNDCIIEYTKDCFPELSKTKNSNTIIQPIDNADHCYLRYNDSDFVFVQAELYVICYSVPRNISNEELQDLFHNMPEIKKYFRFDKKRNIFVPNKRLKFKRD